MNLHDSLYEGELQLCYTDEDEDKDEEEEPSFSTETKEDEESPYYDADDEECLKQEMLHLIFNFDNNNWIDASTKDKGINHVTYHYRFLSSTSYQMRARMIFEHDDNDIFDYYRYLEAGYNDDDMSWMNNKSINKMIKKFDNSHQLMYNKGAAGFWTYIISQRDTCYVRTRFKEKSWEFKQTKYDIAASLNYSVKPDHPFYYPLDAKCIRVDMKYRGFVLVYNKEFKTTELFYVAYFDIKGYIPQWFQSLGLKSIGANYVKQFNETWMDKIQCVRKREKEKQREQLKLWLTHKCKLPQYVDIFIYNGFDDLSYLHQDLTEKDLIDIGIKLKGHRLKIMSEIKKL